jgi:hypothetical protein
MVPLSSRGTHDFSNEAEEPDNGRRADVCQKITHLPHPSPKTRPISLAPRKNAISAAKSAQKHPPPPHMVVTCLWVLR